MGFRKSSSNVEGIEGRERRDFKARNLLDDSASFLQRLKVLGVVKLKRRVSNHSDYHRFGRLPDLSGTLPEETAAPAVLPFSQRPRAKPRST